MVTLVGRPLWADRLLLDQATLANAPHLALQHGNHAFGVLAFLGAGSEITTNVLHALPVVPVSALRSLTGMAAALSA
jgi:hypothetical protein